LTSFIFAIFGQRVTEAWNEDLHALQCAFWSQIF